jgi:iron complex outermembrane receptor protein
MRPRLLVAALGLIAWTPLAVAQRADPSELADLSIEELADLPITSVAKRAQRLADAPASVFVITNDAIRRSGATTLPEALRLAPNLQVARIDASQYAISARGFNNAIGNKLLVMIDGRTVYSPMFSGVFWDQQDVLLEDVERIEVISGPGGTLWGANAVNGVINVVTRSAADTQGTLAAARGGNLEQGADLRYGGKAGETSYRVYAKRSKLQNTATSERISVADGQERQQAGFRTDAGSRSSAYTFQGDAYNVQSEDRPGNVRGVEGSGVNLLGRWTRAEAGGAEYRVQAYYDHSERDDALLYRPRVDIFDIELQGGQRIGDHGLVVGAGYRHSSDDIQPGIFFSFVPASRELTWINGFIQGELRLLRSLTVTGGIKLEHNDYTGTERLPSLRIAWKPADEHLLWGAASRVVRAPARLDHDLRLPANPPFIIVGGSTFVSERAKVYELGYRGQPVRSATFSATGFLYEWTHLRSGEPAPATVQNRIEGRTYGAEYWGTWQVLRDWRLSAGLTTLRTEDLHLQAGSNDPTGPSALGNDPHYQWQIRSGFNLGSQTDFDVAVRRVGELPNPRVAAYTALDMRLAWRVRRDFELSLTGQNLLDRSHPEFGAAPGRSEIDRGAYLQLKWST